MILWFVASSAWVMSVAALVVATRRKPAAPPVEQRRPKLSEVAT